MNVDLKDRIIQNSIGLFCQNGLKNVNTDLIAQEVGISKRTLYEVFPSKEQLIREVLLNLMNTIQQEVQKLNKVIDDGSSDNFILVFQHLMKVISDVLNNFTKQIMTDLKRYYPVIWEEIRAFRVVGMRDEFLKICRYGQSKGFIRDDINVDLIYYIFLFSIDNIMTPEIISELPMSTNNTLKSIFDIFLKCITTDNYRKELCSENFDSF
ncbi:MAG TPA: TetR/AcrR family transcriptional regulator [Candidatus Kapabacteria bacterium]|nr:TetR/AcrR family transcriptional regulator [Candidatus Kapabacteria bacterium]